MANAVIHIFDVEHGACNVIKTPNAKIIMIDCGHNSTTGWRPATWIVQNKLSITNLSVSNIDEDHLSDLVNIDKKCQPETFKINPYMSPDWIERKKREGGGIGPGVQKLLELEREVFTGGSVIIDFGLERGLFNHSTAQFEDFNNLSIVTFIEYAGVGIVFPGDIEKKGWEEFLKDRNFREWLGKTKVFLASHHGRISGYCEDVFKYCSPTIIIISDKAIEHETQLHDEYAKHASGLWFGENLRKVLTTRKDGKITIEIGSDGRYTVHISS